MEVGMAERGETTGGRRSSVDLDRMSVPELTALIAAAEEKRTEKMDEAKLALLDEFREKAADLGLSLEALMPASGTPVTRGVAARGRKARSDSGSVVAAKFRGPNGEEWTGRGRRPKWLSALEAEGHSVDEYRI